MASYWLGVDVGTGGSRALLIDGDGKVVASHTSSHEEILMQKPLWAEQRPENWWTAVQIAIQGVLTAAGVNGGEVKGVGLSGQMHGLVLLDEASQVIRPALIWCDQRSQQQVDFVHNTVGRERVLECIANPVVTGFTLPKLLWVRDNEPQQFARIRKVLLPKDYIRYKLTGEFATEVSDASGTSLFDVVRRNWSHDLLDALGLPADWMPRSYESAEVSGRVSEAAAQATGLVAGTPVVGGGGDQAASAVGNGIVEPGVVSCTVGTSGVVFAHMEKPEYDPLGRVHTFCHAVPGKWHVMGVTQGAGFSFQWFRNTLAPGSDYDELTTQASHAPAGSHGLFWLPYLMGERTPHLDATARGGWIGLTAKHQRADLIRSLLEGVTYSLKDGLDIIEGLGVHVKNVRLSGGGARSAFWKQMFADIFGTRITTLASQEGSAYGAGLLSMVGTGHFGSVEDACRAVIHEQDEVKPSPAVQELYQRGHRLYQELYPALQPTFGQMSELG